jgi:hypothetical protein
VHGAVAEIGPAITLKRYFERQTRKSCVKPVAFGLEWR